MKINGAKIHLIGIGGIGISGLGLYLQSQGAIISGSDIAYTPTIKKLQNQGIKIHIPHSKNAITDQDLVIHSAIISPDNEEIAQAKALKIPIFSRREALSFILAQKRVFSICGAHGKSSTSAMLSSIFSDFGAIIGAESKEFGSNVRSQKNESLIFEADESDKSFLNSNPFCSIITNAEPEHMESYDYNEAKLQDAYIEFINKSQRSIINISCPFLRQIYLSNRVDKNKITALDPIKDIKNIKFFLKNNQPFCSFELLDFGTFEVYGIGEHSAHNAALAILCASFEKSIPEIRENLKNFRGIKKRFDILNRPNDAQMIVIDDYAHHPTEISATLKSARVYASLKGINEVIAIWQPHKYSRLKDNLSAFQTCFKDCDKLIILPVWRTNEAKIDLDMHELFKQYNPIFATHIKRDGAEIAVFSQDEILLKLNKDLAIGLGAGDITYQIRGDICDIGEK
ncbi:MAG: UDP-N-acetylmuramate--L-alanine ligase [Helicobacter sp.]|nr:UDP-N-acetylmuramate--L-alanine ligase [Helicobacter sp.]